MSPVHELEFLITQGRELCVTISSLISLKEKPFLSYPDFQKRKKPIDEKICNLRTLVNTYLVLYPNNDQNANLISSLGSIKSSLNKLQSFINPNQVRSETWRNNHSKLFKKPSSVYANNQIINIDIELSIFTGSLNILESHLHGHLHYEPTPKP